MDKKREEKKGNKGGGRRNSFQAIKENLREMA